MDCNSTTNIWRDATVKANSKENQYSKNYTKTKKIWNN